MMIFRGCSTPSRKSRCLTPTFLSFPVLFVSFVGVSSVCAVKTLGVSCGLLLTGTGFFFGLLGGRERCVGPRSALRLGAEADDDGPIEVEEVEFREGLVLVVKVETGVLMLPDSPDTALAGGL